MRVQGTRYQCWARSQVRYALGAGGRSFMVGFGERPPTHAASPAASCPLNPLDTCSAPRADSSALNSQVDGPDVAADLERN